MKGMFTENSPWSRKTEAGIKKAAVAWDHCGPNGKNGK